MPLHPQARAARTVAVPLTRANLAAAREALARDTAAEAGPGTDVGVVSDVAADGVPCRIYSPGETAVQPVVLYLHGGGWVQGGPDSHDAVCRFLAVLSGAVVVAVDYRLAPEHPYPAPVEDVDRVVAWLHRHGPELGFDPARMAVAGDSAGGHLAAVAARRARDAGTPFVSQVLIYPAVDPAGRTWAGVESPGLLPENMAFFWDSMAPAGVDRAHPDLSPMAADLAGLPPALVITAEYDILRDEGEAYAAALAEAGVPTVAVRYQGQIHGFFRRLARFDAARQAVAQVAASLRAELA